MDEIHQLAEDCFKAVNTQRFDSAQSKWDEVIAVGRTKQLDDFTYAKLVLCIQYLQWAHRLTQADSCLRDVLDLSAGKFNHGVLDRFEDLVFTYRKDHEYALAEDLVRYRL